MDNPEDMLANARREEWVNELGLVKPGSTQSRAESWACLKTEPSRILWEIYVVHPGALPPFSGSDPSTALLASTSLLIPHLTPILEAPLAWAQVLPPP